jgi:hypothetical protein
MINADVRGELRVRAIGADGAALPGFDFDDCAPIKGDSPSHEIRWRGNIATLSEKPLQLEFRLADAHLYAVEVS